MKKVSTIFKEKPEKWGLRGDSYFWDYLVVFAFFCEIPAHSVRYVLQSCVAILWRV